MLSCNSDAQLFHAKECNPILICEVMNVHYMECTNEWGDRSNELGKAVQPIVISLPPIVIPYCSPTICPRIDPIYGLYTGYIRGYIGAI